jgi:hypothetical protein
MFWNWLYRCACLISWWFLAQFPESLTAGRGGGLESASQTIACRRPPPPYGPETWFTPVRGHGLHIRLSSILHCEPSAPSMSSRLERDGPWFRVLRRRSDRTVARNGEILSTGRCPRGHLRSLGKLEMTCATLGMIRGERSERHPRKPFAIHR